jgi:hypothetical protein
MKIILSKEDIEAVVKKYFEMEAVAWADDGTIIIDTTLEKIMNQDNDMETLNERIKLPSYF